MNIINRDCTPVHGICVEINTFPYLPGQMHTPIQVRLLVAPKAAIRAASIVYAKQTGSSFGYLNQGIFFKALPKAVNK